MHNCNYDKVALMHQLKQIWSRLDMYSKDAKGEDHPLCDKMYQELKKDL